MPHHIFRSIRRRTGIGLLSLALAAGPALATEPDLAALPELGDASASLISAAEERRLGQDFMRKARHSMRFVYDPEIWGYLQDLGQRLVSQSEQPDGKFEFYVIDESSLNAFAVPGGFISVHTGLITTAAREAELASVVAHEIAHVTQRHIARMFGRIRKQSMPALAAMIAAILLGGQAGTAALVLTNATIAERQLSYSRSFEREADNTGLKNLAKAGYDPRAMPDFFNRMQRWSRIQDGGAPEFLRTHPLTSDRIAESQSRAEHYPGPPPRSDSDFQHIRAKIRVSLSDEPAQQTKHFQSTLDDGSAPDPAAARYGIALALMHAGRYESARRRINALIQKDPGRRAYRIAQAEIEMVAGQPERGVRLYRGAVSDLADDPVLVQYFARALLRNGRYKEAQRNLDQAIRKQPNSPLLYEMLARAAGKNGDTLTSRRARAEYFYLLGNPKGALEQLRIARGHTGDSFYASASVDARIEEIRREAALAPPDKKNSH